MTLGFSHAGLLALGLCIHPDHPFPAVFRAGMSHPDRRRNLGDEESADWQWGDTDAGAGRAVHIRLAHYWRDGITPSQFLEPQAVVEAGFENVRVVPTCPGFIGISPDGETTMHEPFGFRDGLGQPVLDGLPLTTAQTRLRDALQRAGTPELFDDRRVMLGEFVLGHKNQYGEPSACPDLVDWPRKAAATALSDRFGRNGSFLVVRQIEQHVDTFRAFADACPVADTAERMVGRRRDGTALQDNPAAPLQPDALRYLVSDAEGFQCPRGAHIRRANPRDALARDVASGISSAKLHRLLRRGRVCGTACNKVAGCDGTCPEAGCAGGLMFLALNADLERQFEFVPHSWIVGSGFGDLRDEQDPLLGTRTHRRFSLQRDGAAGIAVMALPRFTTVRGGGDFFVPGLAPCTSSPRSPAPPEPPLTVLAHRCAAAPTSSM